MKEDGVEVMGVASPVEIGEVVGPAVVLGGAMGQLNPQGVLREKLEEPLEVLPQVGSSTGLEGEYIRPVVLLTDVQHGAAGQEGIAANAQAGLREVPFVGGGQSGEGVEFAILFDCFVR